MQVSIIALSTLICAQVNDWRYRSVNLFPAMRMTSATSQRGRVTMDCFPPNYALYPGSEYRSVQAD